MGYDRTIEVKRDVLQGNDRIAERNRKAFRERGICALNILSSPGSGKTTLLEHTIAALASRYPLAVIEGDQQTDDDALRIKAAGARAVQVNTGEGCHLEAGMVARAVQMLDPLPGSLLFIENVGNLVCPALFDLGETARIVLVSVTEGEDKPLKYPYAFRDADVCMVNKIDLLPYLEFDIALLEENIRRVAPRSKVFETSYRTGNDEWIGWLEERIAETGGKDKSVDPAIVYQ